MVSLDDLKDLMIYKKDFYLPINPKNKKKNSLIMLLTPNYKSSANMMTMPYIKNNRYFESYYLEKNIYMYINSTNEKTCIIPEADYEEYDYFTEDFNNGKYMGVDKLSFEGYPTDVRVVQQLVSEKYLNMVAKIYSKDFDGMTIVCGDDSSIDINTNTLNLVRKGKYNSKNYILSYQEYVYSMVHMFYITKFNPKIDINIGYPISLAVSGAYSYLDKNAFKFKFPTVYVLSEVYKNEGILPIKGQIAANNYGAFVAFVYSSQYKYYDNTNAFTTGQLKKSNVAKDHIKMVNAINIIKEDNDTTDSIENSTADETSKTTDSLEDLKKLKTNLKRRIRRQSVYKLNKIIKDVTRGNVGTDSQHMTSLEKLKSGNIVDTAPTPTTESFNISDLEQLDSCLESNGVYYLFEADNYDNIFRKALFKSRFKNNREVLNAYRNIRVNLPFIKYTFLDIDRYAGRNLFFDLSYYNESFFKNISLQISTNTERRLNSVRPYKAYAEFLKRLVKDSRFTEYTKKTIFIPILDWRHNESTRMWIYKEDINPISYIYDLIRIKDIATLKSLFGDADLVFLGDKNYFKLNVSTLEKASATELNNVKTKFSILINRIVKSAVTNIPEEDPVDDNKQDSAKGIAMDIINKIEVAKNVEIDDVSSIDKIDPPSEKPVEKEIVTKPKPVATPEVDKPVQIVKPDSSEKENVVKVDKLKSEIVSKVASASKNSGDLSMALANLNTDEFKEMIEEVESKSDDNVDKEKAKPSKYTKMVEDFHKSKVANKSVEELLKVDNIDTKLEETKLNIASISDDWNHMTFMNFDKKYDPDSDILKMLDSMQHWSHPVYVENIDVKDTSTSEDAVFTWYIKCKDYKNSRFTITIDIPKFINDKMLLLRGNKKTLMIQSTLIPLIKTNNEECQIIGIGGYNKIFVRKYGNFIGKSMPAANKVIKGLEKYSTMDKSIEIIYGDNSTISKKYELPLDYVDIGNKFNKVSIKKKVFILFNQDELRAEVQCDDSNGLPFGYVKDGSEKKVLYWNYDKDGIFSYNLIKVLTEYLGTEFEELCDSIVVSGIKYSYSQASILNIKMPIVLICAYLEGLLTTLKKAGINYEFAQSLNKTGIKYSLDKDFIKFNDGYLVYDNTYSSSLLMNGLKDCATEEYSIKDINDKSMYLDFIDEFGGVLKADGLENSYDCMLDQITKEILEFYKLPTDYVSVLIYASNLLADNKFVNHTDQSARRWRRKELIAGYFYKALSTGYQTYANSTRHNRKNAKIDIKQSAIIDMLLADQGVAELSINNVINDVESCNSVTNKGLVGMNTDRAYSVDKRIYDDSMLNLLGMDTGFSGTVGITRQATMNANIEGNRGFVKSINNNTKKFSAPDTLTATEGSIPLGSTHDDPPRTLMAYVQTSKHAVRCENNDPLLITNGTDEAFPYMASDIFAFKAKDKGKVTELVQLGKPFNRGDYMIISYENGESDYISLEETVEKNSDGGYNVPLKLSTDLKVGAKVKPNEVVAYDKLSFSSSLGESKNLALNSGTLAKIALLNTDEGFEDSAAITEEFGEKLGTAVIVDKEVVLDKGSNIFVYKKIGDEIIEGETLMSFQEDFDDEAVNRLMKNLSIDKDSISELGNNKIVAKHSGVLCDIKVYRTVELDELSESLRSFVSKYESELKKKRSIYNEYGVDASGLQTIGKASNTGKTKNVKDGVKIIFYIKYIDNMSIGDKITFYSANKGVVKYIIPHGEEPTSDFRQTEHIDTFVSMGGVNARMTCSIPIVAGINKVLVELDRSVKELAGIPYDVTKL